MNKSIGWVFTLFVALAVSYAFSARHGPVMPPTENRIENALILDAQRAGARLVAVGERGYIFLSDDEGASWRPAVSGTQSTLTAVAFINARLGVAVGHDAVILRTEDGGQSWKQVFEAADQQRPLLDVSFITPEHLVAVGAYAAYFESHDGGQSWEERQVSEEDRHFNALARLGDGSLLLAGEAGTLMRSRDAGLNWEMLSSPYGGSFFGIQPMPSGPVLIYGMRGTVLRSEDSGDNWQQLDSQGAGSLFASVLFNETDLALLGQSGVLLFSRDAGLSFQRLPLQRTSMLTAGLALTKPDQMLVLGDAGVSPVGLPAGEKQ
jgi:photosystem II stability/assembly factor-like uncharacterized protein